MHQISPNCTTICNGCKLKVTRWVLRFTQLKCIKLKNSVTKLKITLLILIIDTKNYHIYISRVTLILVTASFNFTNCIIRKTIHSIKFYEWMPFHFKDCEIFFIYSFAHLFAYSRIFIAIPCILRDNSSIRTS